MIALKQVKQECGQSAEFKKREKERYIFSKHFEEVVKTKILSKMEKGKDYATFDSQDFDMELSSMEVFCGLKNCLDLKFQVNYRPLIVSWY